MDNSYQLSLDIPIPKETQKSRYRNLSTLNILFVNYGDLRSNSLNHIAPYANELSSRGDSCTVVSSGENQETELQEHSPLFAHYTHQEMNAGIELFPDAKPANIIHAWTPREVVRKSVQTYLSHHPATRLIIHLEDNEEEILKSAHQRPIEALQNQSLNDPKLNWNPQLSHPLFYQEFLSQADGITLLRPSLKRLVPVPKHCTEIQPIHVTVPRGQTDSSAKRKKDLGIKDGEHVIVFPGGVTSSNRSDVRDLLLAVKIINDKGTPCRIIKTGPNCQDLLNSFAFPLDDICIDLGYISRGEIHELLQMADALVQPGKRNAFNEDRFPCKIPEFLASGTPCIIPKMYAPNGYKGNPFCLYLEESSPREIANLAMKLFSEPKLCESLSAAAQIHVRKTYSPSKNASHLVEFYHSISDLSPLERKAATHTRLNSVATEAERVAEVEKLHILLEEEKRASQKLNKENNQLKAQFESTLDQLRRQDDRLARMRSTFSWKITSPLRALRRKFIDKPQKTSNVESIPNTEKKVIPQDLPPPNHPSYHKDYHLFIKADKARIQKILNSPPSIKDSEQPKISILLPVYNVAEIWLRKCIDSVLKQNYHNWELCIADDASNQPHIRKIIENYLNKDNRIRAIFREKNGHISLATNSAYTLASGDYLALLDHDDELAPHALMRVAECIRDNPEARLIYSDEDKIDEQGLRHGPHFKSDWNYDLFLGCNMISHLGVYHRENFEKVDGFRPGFEGAQDWDLALRIIETISPSQIIHIPEILYHWRDIEGSTAQNLDQKSYANAAQKKAIESHLARLEVNATIESVDGFDWKINYAIPHPAPRVSIIIPTKDRIDLLKPCIDSILEKTNYQNYEIVIVDNASQRAETLTYFEKIKPINSIRILKDEGEFNYSRINNDAIATCESELICLLNNDTEVISPCWLREMVQHGIRKEIGVVGAKLLYPHDHVQHGGVIMGIGGIAAHAFKLLHRSDDGHIHRAHLVSGYSATTGACMLFRKKTWKGLGGFDEENLPVSYNDVDFCLRANAKGLRTIVTPFALLYHKESESRGSPTSSPERSVEFQRESSYMRSKWSDIIKRDPYYNPNLTQDREDFSYKTAP